jgi:hypothetical protein
MAKKDDPNALRSRILTVFLESSVVCRQIITDITCQHYEMNLIHILFGRSKRASTCSYLFVILLACLHQVHSWTTHLADNPALRLHPVRLRSKETESPFCYA